MTMEPKCTPPDIMVCYRVKKNSTYQPNSNNSHPMANGLNNQTANSMHTDPQAQANAMRQTRLRPGGLPLKQSKSRELRAGIMYTGCDCEKRNGLQDDCLRSECRGSPQCLTKPNPTCGPSEFSNGKHLELKRLTMEKEMAQLKADRKLAEIAQYREADGDTANNAPAANKSGSGNKNEGGGNRRNSGKANSSSDNTDGAEEYCCYEAIALSSALMCNGLDIGMGRKDEQVHLVDRQ